jgi:PAS domain S-box-containing protein
MGVIFLFFIATIWLLGTIQSKSANEAWGIKLMQTNLELKKQQTLLPIIKEIHLVRQLAHEPAIIAMANNDSDPHIRAAGLKVLEKYRLGFQDKSYFASFTKGFNYYYDDNNHSNKGKNPLHTLNPKSSEDQWFYATIASGKPFEINVQAERVMKITKIWIDYVVKDHGRIVGVIGTGFNLNDLLVSSTKTSSVKSFFIKKDLSVQLASDHNVIDYNNIFKESPAHKTITKMIDNPLDIALIKDAVETLEYEPNSIKIFWMMVHGEKNLVGITYSPEIELYDVTFFTNKELVLLDNRTLFIFLILLFILSIIVVGVWISRHILFPIEQLKKEITTFHHSTKLATLTVMHTHEIGQLTNTIQSVLDQAYQQQTTLLLSKNHLEGILAHTKGAIAIIDTHHTLVVVNSAWEKMLGYDLYTLQGKMVKTLLPAHEWRGHLSFLQTLDRPMYHVSQRYLTCKGEIRTVFAHFIPMESGEIVVMVQPKNAPNRTIHCTIHVKGNSHEA